MIDGPNISEAKFRTLMDDAYMLRKEDIIWILNYIKQKAADKDQGLLDLQQPRLLQNFHYYAEVSMLLLQSRTSNIQEYDHIRNLLKEACFGLIPNRT